MYCTKAVNNDLTVTALTVGYPEIVSTCIYKNSVLYR